MRVAGERAGAGSAPTLLALLLLLTGCPEQPTGELREVAGRPVRAVATTSIVADMVRQIAGDRVELHALMGPGIDPHLYRASEGDMRRLAEADVVFYNGLHLESKLGDVLGQLRKPTVALAESVPPASLLSSEDGGAESDPHVWFDVEAWALCAAPVETALAGLAPQHAAEFAQRATAYRAELAALHAHVRELVETVPAEQRVLVTAHDAFRYFGRAYDFEVVGLQGISTEAEAGTGDVQQLARFIAERRIPAIFVESSVPVRNVQAVQAAVRARDWDVRIGGELFSDALGDADGDAGTYTGMVRHNVTTIIGALTGGDEQR